MQKVKPFDSCQVCGSTDLYFAYDGSTLRLNQICNKCHTVHYLTTVLPKEKRGKNMRIVPNLNEIKECPCCGSNTLALYIHGDPSISDYKKCPTCGEKIYTNETTYSVEKTTKEKEKENFIFEIREEISYLTWFIHDSKTRPLVENIQNILNRIIDYIEEN